MKISGLTSYVVGSKNRRTWIDSVAMVIIY